MFTLAIIGRPNVGKSTLFNRLVGRRLALVDDRPGVTRDHREGEGRLGELVFRVFDTAGLEDSRGSTLEGRMRLQTESAVATADLVLMTIDARVGVTPVDKYFGNWLRRISVPVLVIANKCEGSAVSSGIADCYQLGLGEPIPISAVHGDGINFLYEGIKKYSVSWRGNQLTQGPQSDQQLQIAIVGRPNVGKSTLVNKLLGEERVLTGPEPGLTRDAIGTLFCWQGRSVRLIDTAGLRRKANVVDPLEKLSVGDTNYTIQFAQVVILLVDARTALERQDLTIARRILEEGRALIIAANKWDLIKNATATSSLIRDRVRKSLSQARGVPVIKLSALNKMGLNQLMLATFEIYEKWNIRISTAKLNQWLTDVVALHPPPLAHNRRRIRIRYITQAKTRPPTFVIFVNFPKELPESYIRYLQNGIREDFNLSAVPLRIQLRKHDNPYVPNSTR